MSLTASSWGGPEKKSQAKDNRTVTRGRDRFCRFMKWPVAFFFLKTFKVDMAPPLSIIKFAGGAFLSCKDFGLLGNLSFSPFGRILNTACLGAEVIRACF